MQARRKVEYHYPVSYETLSRRRVWAPSVDQNLADCPPLLFAAKDALTQFASRQLGLALGPRRWDTRVERMDLATPAGWQPGAPLAVLDLLQTPPVILGIELDQAHQFTAWIMRERAGPAEPGRPLVWKAAQAILLPAEVQQLHSALEKLLAEGVIVKTPEGLRFTGKRPAFRSL
jgi:hypothetical protein